MKTDGEERILNIAIKFIDEKILDFILFSTANFSLEVALKKNYTVENTSEIETCRERLEWIRAIQKYEFIYI